MKRMAGWLALSVGCVFALSCGGETARTGPRPTTPGNIEAALEREEIVGHWVGDWGEMELRIFGDEIWGVYNHEQGTLRGEFRDGVFRGWWTQAPTRMAPHDAGEVEFLFSHNDQGELVVDGRYKYGADTDEWMEDWDLGLVSGPINDEDLARFNDATLFHAHP